MTVQKKKKEIKKMLSKVQKGGPSAEGVGVDLAGVSLPLESSTPTPMRSLWIAMASAGFR
jgi:hypothetical protein